MMTETSAEVTTPLGDGRRVIGFQSLNTRPAYWIVCVDSSWSLDNNGKPDTIYDHSDEICTAIEEEFGIAECGYCGDRYGAAGCDECRDEPEDEGAFPHFRFGDGVCWFLIRDEAAQCVQ